MKDHRVELTAFAAILNTNLPTLSIWFNQGGKSGATRGRTLQRRVLERMAQVLNISFEHALAEAGGRTSEDLKRETGRRMLALNRPQPGTPVFRAVHRKVGAFHRRKPKSAEAIRKRTETRMARDAYGKGKPGPPASIAALAKASKSIKMQIVKSFLMRLRYGDPTEENVQRWVHDISRTISQKTSLVTVTPTMVTSYLRPYMKKRGIGIKIGRPRSNSERWLEIEALKTTWPLDQDGGLADGFWDAALAQIQRLEGKKAPTSKDSLRQSWIRHKSSEVPPTAASA